ncbi:MAG: sigma-54-dependent Fis family transcriptional regulator [Oceanospirillaceae bacterium]|uniref:sigma-54-dependent transcriptional regulator n=1 Tax=unclassified Thalassolituus TaxID=2624967 RepID=UPI000C6938CB|nr:MULTISPECIES: sigma-54 dependent transcriptional regulator [unclassified Thalassolituus]MAS24600.1 sigma-54-dependent Fis family transcriptional regulator [Oceanospirillaceae bacterium]MBL35755.1 sigma-54-dependent Fis family transcriptional regulator [Oceanospirillaceae bacterium]MBS52738.1 sigma-54-dependent Fis family transcriptional regulator [Oceanospirillaceae bacterium]
MSKYAALIIDDEPDIRTLIAITLQRMDLDCYQAANVSEAKALLNERPYHFCITDMKLPDGNGLELIEQCNAQHPDMPVAMITAYGNMELAVNALKAGAFDVVAKPLDTERLRELVKAALQLTRVPANIENIPSADGLLGDSVGMHDLKQRIYKVARTQAPVFIQGEPGTGKELIARLIHHQSARMELPFIAVNCGAIERDQMESEFFGQVKGGMIPDRSDKPGFFRAAHGGTLFLDEVAELPLDMQAKLLRAIQEQSVRAIGSDQETPVNVRILCASHKDLAAMVSQGSFRQDLYFRLNVIQIDVPRLADRREDIPMLVRHFIIKYSKEWDMPEITLDADAYQAMLDYDFPGNVRELENILQRAVTLAEGDSITLADIRLQPSSGEPSAESRPQSSASEQRIETNNLEAYLENIERSAITQALEATRWNKTAAAEKLGISFRALRYRCKKLGID